MLRTDIRLTCFARLLGPDPESDGNIYRPGNIDSFRQFVHDNTDGKGVHFFTADGVSSLLSHLNWCRMLNVLVENRSFFLHSHSD